MENAADALKMAAAVLIFVLALSISINAFGEARMTVTKILEYGDREYDYTYVEDNGTTERIVGLETIVPTIYKAYKENYKIVFDTGLLSDGLYKKKNSEGTYESIYYIDLEREILGNESQKERFIQAILYGNKYENFATADTEFNTNFGIDLNETGIYDKINNVKVVEKLGVYYQEETPGKGGEDATGSSSVPNVNKTIKRVITYSKSNN